MPVPASIRTNNPGAQWMGPVARQYGATERENLPGGNNAAVFADSVAGAAAHFALLGKDYAGMPLSGAIGKWSGGNSSPAYTKFITDKTGLAPDTVLTPELLQGPQGLALAKAQAHWEAGQPYPLSDEQWQTAQSRAYGGQGGAPVAAPTAAPGILNGATPPQVAAASPSGPSSQGIGIAANKLAALLNPPAPQVAPLAPIQMARPVGSGAGIDPRALIAAMSRGV